MTLKPTGQFRKDFKLAKKRGLDITLLEAIIGTLLDEKTFDEKYRDYTLTGNYIGFRECHIQSPTGY